MIVPKYKWRYPLAIEREYAQLLYEVVHKKFAVIESFLPEIVDTLYQNSIKQDVIGDWFGNLLEKVRRKVEKISALPLVEKIFGKVDKHVKQEQAETFKSVFGAEPRIEQKPRELETLKTIWVSQNMTLIKSIDTQAMDKIQFSLSQKIIAAANKEILMKDLTREIQELAGVSERRAVLIGADQVGKLNGKLVQYRQQSAGIEYFIWRTMGDNRVRLNHAAKNGVVYKWSTNEEKPGDAVRCRCVAQPVIDEQSFKLVPQNGSYTAANENAIITPSFITQKYEDVAKHRTLTEFVKIANDFKPTVEEYTGRKSKWSGEIIFDSQKNSGKLWDCGIRLQPDSPKHVLLHEMIHASSISHYGDKVYFLNQESEELAVHFLSQEIAVKEKIKIVNSGYDSGVKLIRDFKKALKTADSDLEFAVKLIKQHPAERWNWLEEQIADSFNNKMSVGEYQNLVGRLEEIKQWRLPN